MPEYTEKDVIWVEEARFKYGHSRDWYMRRINDGRLRAVYLPGSIRVYLVREARAISTRAQQRARLSSICVAGQPLVAHLKASRPGDFRRDADFSVRTAIARDARFRRAFSHFRSPLPTGGGDLFFGTTLGGSWHLALSVTISLLPSLGQMLEMLHPCDEVRNIVIHMVEVESKGDALLPQPSLDFRRLRCSDL